MPKRIITKPSLPKVLRELDRWEGKLTWPLFCAHVAKVLGVESVSKHTMYLYPTIKEGFQRRQRHLRESAQTRSRDLTLDVALRRIADLEAQVVRLQETNDVLLEQFHRWQYNALANNIRMDLLAWDKPLPAVDRSGRARSGERQTAKKTGSNSQRR
jgi:hypothetical protein